MEAASFPVALRVLAVDEDRVNLAVLKRALEVCNYNNVTTVTTDASTALDILRERKDRDDQFDLVIGEFFMPNNGTNGLKLLELIALEMDIPVIVLSANDEMETMVKAIKHGACDYMIKPVHLEKVRNIWMHVVRKSKGNPRNKVNSGIDNPGEMVQSMDDGNCGKDDAKHTRKHRKKNIKDGEKKQRVEWSSELHAKFVEAINLIGLDKAVPKKILEVMNVDGLSRENVASHLQKYRMHLKKWKEGTFRYSAFMYEQHAWLNGKAHVNTNMSIPECSSTDISNEHPPLGMSFPSSCSGISYASKLRASILGSNKGIPFDPDGFFEEIDAGEMSAVQIGNYVMPTQMLKGGGASSSLPKGSNVDPRPVGDQMKSNNELSIGTDEAQNGAIDIDDFVAEWLKQDSLNNNDTFFNGNTEFAP